MQNTVFKSVEGSQDQVLESIFTMRAISFVLEGNDDIEESEEELEEDEQEEKMGEDQDDEDDEEETESEEDED